MSITNSDDDNNLKVAERYYAAMLKKNFDEMAGYLHDNVYFLGTLAEMHGRDTVVSAAKNFAQILQNIHIRSKFACRNQVMFSSDFTFLAPIGKLRVAVFMEFTDQKISKIELFYDGRPFMEKRDEIFEKKVTS